jgi:hypothetical protein
MNAAEDGKYINSSYRDTGIDINGLNKEADRKIKGSIRNILARLKSITNFATGFSADKGTGVNLFRLFTGRMERSPSSTKRNCLSSFLSLKNIFPGNQVNHPLPIQVTG